MELIIITALIYHFKICETFPTCCFTGSDMGRAIKVNDNKVDYKDKKRPSHRSKKNLPDQFFS